LNQDLSSRGVMIVWASKQASLTNMYLFQFHYNQHWSQNESGQIILP
jgi:hypothetical protein